MLDLTRSLDAAAPAPLYQQLYDSLSAQIPGCGNKDGCISESFP